MIKYSILVCNILDERNRREKDYSLRNLTNRKSFSFASYDFGKGCVKFKKVKGRYEIA